MIETLDTALAFPYGKIIAVRRSHQM